MIILAIESSGNVASAAVAERNKILAEYTVNIGKTHSQTLLPMIDRVLGDAEMSVNDLDAIAVSRGPGSFTGLRIGSATAKGLAASAGIPILEVPTLEALAVGVGNAGGRLICPVIDARRNEVYTALYEVCGESIEQVGEERAMSMEDLLTELMAGEREVIFTGDALRIHGEKIKSVGQGKFILAPLSARDLRAGCVATVGLSMLESGKAIEGSQHSPVYLRLSSAERERLEQGKPLE
ncbi:MAG: tRNA (adenosine(37)-N6)-threonylcarbamoyltransferase complex dimerization subunit type 1 TsaB [Lachnospiraceae bacterium]|nr:tRNA (adenosine(37)-N6)-threonylcarbamoyltransferase complex dimerization subunit type 1 TsaB [Lachnospiraceae bacterium]